MRVDARREGSLIVRHSTTRVMSLGRNLALPSVTTPHGDVHDVSSVSQPMWVHVGVTIEQIAATLASSHISRRMHMHVLQNSTYTHLKTQIKNQKMQGI